MKSETSGVPPENFRVALILGGARSGKSRYGLSLAERFPAPRLFLATGEARDEEMAARINAHQAERGPGWETREEPLDLSAAVSEGQGRYNTILVDCLTMWLANLMLRQDVSEEGFKTAALRLLAVLDRITTPTICISNEVGLGIVPESPLSRQYRDWLGWLHQQLAKAADLVVLVVAGLPLTLKGK
ncbi:MAG: bifunctional adenosylcobinamide kinase/adenosylcobinamide-phosphate guanylyltransferase [Deltaproteobacteria bacterium]|nr:bifunctional adenosylcobinamide kinase/adenosylcobinamide-phosphate guanylyltransferase [Deltaproteobacteria bacterium]